MATSKKDHWQYCNVSRRSRSSPNEVGWEFLSSFVISSILSDKTGKRRAAKYTGWSGDNGSDLWWIYFIRGSSWSTFYNRSVGLFSCGNSFLEGPRCPNSRRKDKSIYCTNCEMSSSFARGSKELFSRLANENIVPLDRSMATQNEG